VIIRHKYTDSAINKYYTAFELIEEVNNLPFSDKVRIHDVSLLQQGLYYFKRVLGSYFPHLILNKQQLGDEYLTPRFGKLEPHKVAYDIKFISEYSSREFSAGANITLGQVYT